MDKPVKSGKEILDDFFNNILAIPDVEEKLASQIKTIDWSNYGGSDGQMPKYCTNDVCEVNPSK